MMKSFQAASNFELRSPFNFGETRFNHLGRFFLELGYDKGPQCLQRAYHHQMKWDMKVARHKKNKAKGRR